MGSARCTTVAGLVILLSACSGGGGGSGPQDEPLKLGGIWTFTERSTSSTCAELAGRSERYRATIDQSGDLLSVVTPYGTFAGATTPDAAAWAGDGETADGRALRITALEVQPAAGGFAGSYAWELRDAPGGAVACAGEMDLAGVRGAPPLPPTGLAAGEVTATTVALTWSAGSDDTDGFLVERTGPACAEPWTAAGSTSASTLTAGGLAAGTAYCFRAVAHNGTGSSSPSATARVRTAAAPPAAPAGLLTIPDGSDSIRLVWSHAGAGLSGFHLAARPASNPTYGSPVALEARLRSVEARGLSPGTAYQFRLTAYNEAGESTAVEAAGTTRPAGSDLPAPGSPAAQAISPTQINLSWTYGANGQAGFKVHRGTALVATVAPTTRAFVVGGLRQGQVYSFTVTAFDALGDSPPSPEVAARTSAEVVGVTWDLTYRVTSSSCGLSTTLHYTDVVVARDGGRVTVDTGYGVLAGTLAGSSLALTGHLGSGTTGLDVTSSSLTVAQDGNAISGTATWAIGTCHGAASVAMGRPIPPLDPPTAPAGLRATASAPQRIHLGWSAASANTEAYRIYRTTGGSAMAAVAVVRAPDRAYDDGEVLPGKSYRYQVAAYNSDGESPRSAEAAATTPAVAPSVPAPPAALQAHGEGSTAVLLSWTDGSDNEAGFRILRGPAGGGRAVIGAVGAGVAGYHDTSVAADTAYDYEVRAFNAAGESAGATATAHTAAAAGAPPAAPAGLAVAAIGPTWARLTWTDQSSDEDRFVVLGKPALSFLPPNERTSVGPDVTTATVEGLDPGIEYRFQVVAARGADRSDPSNQVAASTPPAAALAAPTGLSAAATSPSEIELRWTDASTGEEGFRVYQAVGGCGAAFLPLGTVGAGTTAAVVATLQPATAYCYKVTAYLGGTESAFSAAASATTRGAPGSVRLVNDLSSRVDAYGTDWGDLNQVGRVRIGPFRPELVNAECASVYPSTANERLNRYDFVDLDHLDWMRSIPPGASAEFELGAVGDAFCLYAEMDVWRLEVPICCDGCDCSGLLSGWHLQPSVVLDCADPATGEPTFANKWFFDRFETAETREVRLSQFLPLESFFGTSFCP